MKCVSISLRWVVVLVLLSGIVITVIISSEQDIPPAPVMVERAPYKIPVRKAPFLSRLIPRTQSWAWFWRLKQSIFGKAPSIDIETATYAFTNSTETVLSRVRLGPSDYTQR